MKKLDLLIEQQADIEATDEKGATAIFGACWRGHANVVEKLINHGASVDIKNEEGMTAFHEAVSYGQFEAVGYFLRVGKNKRISPQLRERVKVDVNQRLTGGEWKGMTALHMASHMGFAEIARLLIEHGAEINARFTHKDFGEVTALDIALKKNNSNVAKILQTKGGKAISDN